MRPMGGEEESGPWEAVVRARHYRSEGEPDQGPQVAASDHIQCEEQVS